MLQTLNLRLCYYLRLKNKGSCVCYASKLFYLHLSIQHNIPNTYPQFFNTHLSSFSTLDILGLFVSQSLNWKIHIPLLTKSASAKMVVMYRLHQFSPAQMLSIYRALNVLAWCMDLKCVCRRALFSRSSLDMPMLTTLLTLPCMPRSFPQPRPR